MAQDYTGKKISIFSGINDIPRLATATQAENGSDHSERINTICDYLDTDISALESKDITIDADIANIQAQIDNLVPSSNTNTVLNVNINGTWFNSPSTVYMLVIFVPFELNLLEYSSGDVEVRDLYFGKFNNSDINSNNIASLNRNNDNTVWTIDDFNVSQDIGNFIDRWGKGWYVFVPLNEVSGGYSTDHYLVDNGNPLTIAIDSLDRNVVGVFDLNIYNGFIPIKFNLAMNSPLDNYEYYQALRVNDTKFNGTITINDF